jgi:PEP-CTERM motif-containing protein
MRNAIPVSAVTVRGRLRDHLGGKNMTTYTKLRITAFLTLALMGLVSGVGWAGAVIEVRIDDLTDTPGVTLFSSPTPQFTPTILPDTAGEFLHFTLPAFPNQLGTTFYSDLFEDVVGGTLSDRLLVTYVASSSTVDVKFASDPATIILPPGASNFVNRVEDGTFQILGQFQIYSFQVRSDRSDVPAPATLLLLGSGLAALGGAAWKRCRRA